MISLLQLLTFLLTCIFASQISESETQTDSAMIPDDIMMEVGVRLDEQGLRNLMRVSRDFARFAEYLITCGPVPLSAWSMNILVRYLKANTFTSIENAYDLTYAICQRASPPSSSSLEDCSCLQQEQETCAYFDLMALSWLPTPEILLPEFMRSRIYWAQCFWSSEPQLFWVPEEGFTLDSLVKEMEKYTEGTFTAAMLAITSQPVFRHLLVPFFTAHVILPTVNSQPIHSRPAVELLIRRMSIATKCFDPLLILIFQLIQAMGDIMLRANLGLCLHATERSTGVLGRMKILERIISRGNPNLCFLHDRTAILMASLCRMNVRRFAEILHATMKRYQNVSPESHLEKYLNGEWTVNPIPMTAKGVLSVAAYGSIERVELFGGILLPPGAIVSPYPTLEN